MIGPWRVKCYRDGDEIEIIDGNDEIRAKVCGSTQDDWTIAYAIEEALNAWKGK